VHRDHLSDAEELACLCCGGRVHRETITDRQKRDLWFVHLANQTHVAEQTGITGEIDRPAVLERQDVARRLEQVSAMRERGEVTLPTTVAEERATNPFVRASDVEEFARLRSEKDSFR